MPSINPYAAMSAATAGLPDYSGMREQPVNQVPQGTVPIHQSAWKAGGQGPINLAGQGMYMYGSEQPKPSPMPWWLARNDAIEQQRKQRSMEDRNRIFSRDEIRRMLGNNPTKEAFGAIEAATSYEARMNFNHAINAGMPPQEAHARYGALMNRPSRGMQQSMQPEVRPEVMDLPGLPGQSAVRVGNNRFQVVNQNAGQEPGISTTDQIRIMEAYLKDIDAQLKIVRNPFYTLPDKQQKITALETQRKEVMSGIGPAQPVVGRPVLPRQMPTGRPAAGPTGNVVIRDKRTGKKGYYPANKISALSKDRFEVME